MGNDCTSQCFNDEGQRSLQPPQHLKIVGDGNQPADTKSPMFANGREDSFAKGKSQGDTRIEKNQDNVLYCNPDVHFYSGKRSCIPRPDARN